MLKNLLLSLWGLFFISWITLPPPPTLLFLKIQKKDKMTGKVYKILQNDCLACYIKQESCRGYGTADEAL